MSAPHSNCDTAAILQELVGYLNLSAGSADPLMLRNLSELYRRIGAETGAPELAWLEVPQRLERRLADLEGSSAAFREVDQAREVLKLVYESFLPQYRRHHQDLLFHQSDAALWTPYFIGRVFEAVLRQGGPWDETDRIVGDALELLNDYIGHRPVAVLQRQRLEPYANEWLRPIPLHVRGSGVAVGPYQALITQTLAILESTPPELLREADFDPKLLDELAVDPRAYDFDHPVNKRPNYHFGQWDPHHIDNQGRYRRFVVQQVSLDALLQRVGSGGELPSDELLFEAAAVLAGTILMASGTSGSGPDAHDSSVSLSTLLPRIARYRDAFYQQLIAGVPGAHGERLRAEAVAGRQPFAGARQHLNHFLARRRATQLERVHLALIFARLGQPEAAIEQAHVVPVASARILCEIHCRISTGHLAIEMGDLARTADLLGEIEDFLHRGIHCGALVDPWNILGFQGQFSLFPSPENSVPDHRVEELINLLEQIFGLSARLWSEAAARDMGPLQKTVSTMMRELAQWWDKFAATTVDGIEAFSGSESFESARQVAAGLQAWHKAGAAAGDIAFWRKHVDHFHSPKAYALVVDALLEKRDFVAALALLMQWLGQAGEIGLKQGEYSFHRLAKRLLGDVCAQQSDAFAGVRFKPHEQRALVSKFFDYLEANAEDFWQAPQLEITAGTPQAASHAAEPPPQDEDDDNEHLYDAAYDQVVYIDSTDDGVEGEMLEAGGAGTNYELELEGRRLRERLAFLTTVASLWRTAALASLPGAENRVMDDEVLARWYSQTRDNHERLEALLVGVNAQKITQPSASRESLLEYDRRRSVKEALLETIIATSVETTEASRLLGATSGAAPAKGEAEIPVRILRAVLSGDAGQVRQQWPKLMGYLKEQPLLYVPLAKGGDPRRIVQVRALEQTMRDLLRSLPRLGLLRETCQLIAVARTMESKHPVGPGAVTEFDRLFSVGYRSIVETLVAVSAAWAQNDNAHDSGDEPENELIECLELLTESLLKQWLGHSRTLRLSVMEKIGDDKNWQALVAFIERYGQDLFTQRFLNLGNLRAILHQGVDVWLAHLEEDPQGHDDLKLLTDLGGELDRDVAVKHLSQVIEAVAENYAEYRDYNTTTTQSDRGELVYMLLDFLRLRVQYDRVAWHLKPVQLAHEILVRGGRSAAAEMWRRSLAERTSDVADTLERRAAELRKKYGMRLPTVSDRIAERFIRPLAIDRIRALVQPAIDEVRHRQPAVSFQALEQETGELAQEPTGVGLDVPAWLQELEEEVERARWGGPLVGQHDESQLPLAQAPLSFDEVQRQLTGWEEA